jgi:branched-chain amino acid transport system substrate-binding protein
MKKPIVLLGLMALCLSACAEKPEPIKLGYIGPLSGDAAAYGVDTLNGVRIAVEEVNKAGGVNGRPLEIIAEDGMCTGSGAVVAARKLIEVDKVVAIIGGQCDSETLAAAPIAESGGVILVSPMSGSPDITTAGDFVFRLHPSDALRAKAVAKVFAKKGYKKIAIFTEKTEYNEEFRDALIKVMGKENVTVNEAYDTGAQDFKALLAKHKSKKFDVLFVNGESDATIAPLTKQLREAGFKQPLFSGDGADYEAFAASVPEANGLELVNLSSKLGDRGMGSFGSIFRGTYGEPEVSMSVAALAYDATKFVAEAMAKTALEGQTIRDYLYMIPDYKGAVGNFHFDTNGDGVGIGYALKKFQSGTIVEVEKVVP